MWGSRVWFITLSLGVQLLSCTAAIGVAGGGGALHLSPSPLGHGHVEDTSAGTQGHLSPSPLGHGHVEDTPAGTQGRLLPSQVPDINILYNLQNFPGQVELSCVTGDPDLTILTQPLPHSSPNIKFTDSGQGKTANWTASGDEASGVLCRANHTHHYHASAPLMAQGAHLVPARLSFTINKEEDLTVEFQMFQETHIQWQKFGDSADNWKEGQITQGRLVIPHHQLNDSGASGIYMVRPYSGSQDTPHNQTLAGTFSLLVRECPAERYGPPACALRCPDCLYGGICHDITGLCVCPPGLTGPTCHTSCPESRVGGDCGVVVSDGGGGVAVCLPHPLGCHCTPGYKGFKCHQECDDGLWGSGCYQKCPGYCQSGCHKVTGYCLNQHPPLCTQDLTHLAELQSREMTSNNVLALWKKLSWYKEVCGVEYRLTVTPLTGVKEGTAVVDGLVTELSRKVEQLSADTDVYVVTVQIVHASPRVRRRADDSSHLSSGLQGPQLVITHEIQASEVIFSWSSAATASGDLQYSYQNKINYKACTSSEGDWSSWSDWSNQLSMSLPRKTHSTMSLRVKAKNSGGEGEPAEDNVDIEPAVPGAAITELTCAGNYPTSCSVKQDTTCETKNGPGLTISYDLMQSNTKERYGIRKLRPNWLQYQGRARIITLPRDLLPYTRYIMEAYPANDIGRNNDTTLMKKAEFTSGPERPGPVTNLQAVSASGTITVTWETPQDNPPKGQLEKYFVGWWKKDRINYLGTVELDSPASRHTITGLENDQEYIIKVEAKNKDVYGYGFHKVVSATPQGPLPGLQTTITHEVTDSLVVFSWQTSVTAGEDEDLQYRYQTKINYKACTSSAGYWSSWSNWSTQLSMSLPRKPHSTMSLRVKARNSGREGEPAEDNVDIGPAVPGAAVTELTCTGNYPTSCSVKLETTCEKQNGPGLTISYDLMQSNTKERYGIQKLLANRLGYQDMARIILLPRDLLPYTRYIMEAYPANDIGRNNDTTLMKTAEFTSRPEIPSPVTDLRDLAVSQTNLILTWGEPIDPAGTLTGYKATLSLVGEQGGAENHVDVMNFTEKIVQFAGLEAGRLYRVRVEACNNMSCGITGQPLDVWTSPWPPVVGDGPVLTSSSPTSITFSLPSLYNPPGWQWIILKNVSKEKGDTETGEEDVNVLHDLMAQARDLVNNQTATTPEKPEEALEHQRTGSNETTVQEDGAAGEESPLRIAALILQEEGNLMEDFTVGDNRTYHGYYNHPLDTYSHHWVLVVTEKTAGPQRELITSTPLKMVVVPP